MNDFTKEELEDIKYLIDEYESHYGEYGREGLGDKIRNMIDNYCEHIWTDGSGNNIFCAICHKHGGKR